jgi:hypothetical protein
VSAYILSERRILDWVLHNEWQGLNGKGLKGKDEDALDPGMEPQWQRTKPAA